MDRDSEYKRWEEELYRPAKQQFPERKNSFQTTSGITVPPIISKDELEETYLEDLGFPGEYPFTRGVQPTMYRGRFWTMRQYAGYASANESNQRYHYLLKQGQTGLSVAFDLPTQIGYDSDDPLAHGEVGKVGVAISSLQDMETLFRDIPLGEVSTSMTINAPAAILLAMYVAVSKEQGIETSRLRGTIQNDILKEYVARGTYIFPPLPSMRLITDVFSYCEREIPRWNTISVSGYHIREAGSTAVQEIAFTMANAIAYVEFALESGLIIDKFARQISFFFNAHNNFLEEIAKFRAARRIWARLMSERFGAQDPSAMKLRFHTQTGGSTLTAQQPENNAVRVALQALSAVMGGTQSLHTNSMDEALWLPTENAVRLALRTQQIIAHESGVADTIDPLAGSYFIEYLTDQIEQRVWDYLDRIEQLGGALTAIEQGFIQNEIQNSAYTYQRDIESEGEIVVGMNKYLVDETIELERLQVDPRIEADQLDRLAALRIGRDQSKVSELLSSLEKAAQGKENLMPIFIECVESQITLGEICAVLRQVWGEYQPPAWT